MKQVLLLSGGLDSCVLLRHLMEEKHDIHCLAINYGQRHSKELLAAKNICQTAGVNLEIVDLSELRHFMKGSSQTDDIPVPDGHYQAETMKVTVVPNRNMLMLSVAVSWAISLKADAVAYAAHTGDHAIYPDCRPEFVEAMKQATRLCDYHQVQLNTPFLNFSKTQIVERGQALNVDFSQTWSCYKGGQLHCGKCGTCTERKEAFEQAGVEDPTSYEEVAA